MTIATQPFPAPSPVGTREQVTPDDLLKLGQQGLFELVDGELVEKPTGALSGKTVVILSSRLYPFIWDAGLGELYSQTTFRCFPNNPNRSAGRTWRS